MPSLFTRPADECPVGARYGGAERDSPGRFGRFRNLLLAALLVPFAVYTLASVANRGLFEYVGTDFRTMRASAEIARSISFASVYDLDEQERRQAALYERYSHGDWRLPLYTNPMPYAPVFVAAMLPLTELDPIHGFLLYTGASAVALVAYLRWFAGRVGLRAGVAPTVLFSLAAYTTLLYGQVNVWLVIFVGQLLLAYQGGRPTRAGLWLGGLLLKPQLLLLLLPALLVGREWRVLGGFGLAAGAALAASLALAGPAGLQAQIGLIVFGMGGTANTFPDAMANWRALALNLARWQPPEVGWFVAAVGLALSVLAGLVCWRGRGTGLGHAAGLRLLATLAATLTVSWHSHLHMALALVPLLIWAVARAALPRTWLDLWLLGPSVLFLVALLPLGPGPAQNLAALGLLLLNAALAAWAARAARAEPARGAAHRWRDRLAWAGRVKLVVPPGVRYQPDP